MAKLMNVVNRASGHAYSTRFSAAIEGGPALNAALQRLEDAVRVKAAKAAVEAMGAPIEESWKRQVPTGPAPIHLEEAISTKVSKTKTGASGSIAVRRVPGAATEDQPTQYAKSAEYGNRDQAAQPAARPAFDQEKQHAVEAAEAVLRDAVRGSVR